MSPRQALEEIDPDPALSTSNTGDFLRRRTRGFYFADSREVGDAALPGEPLVANTPFWKSLVDGTPRGWGFLALMVFGLLMILLGLAVVANKGPQGWIPVIFGVVLIAVPIVITARQRGAIRAKEDKQRAEREERERRNREMLAAYIAALEKLRPLPTEEALAAVLRERQVLELPYNIWARYARRTLLLIGFEALARQGTGASREVAKEMSRAAYAMGLENADEVDVKTDLYRVVLWHLLADDRHGDAQVAALTDLRHGFDISERDLGDEIKVVDELQRLRGITRLELPRVQCSIKVSFHEYCIHTVRATVIRKKDQRDACTLYVTNKRVVLDGYRRQPQLDLQKIDDVEVDVDQNVLTIKTARGLPTIQLQVEDPIYTAALIDIATTINERPRGFA